MIARGSERIWLRARAWAELVQDMMVNPHHHVRQYHGDFDSFVSQWVTWQPYAHFYQLDDVDQEEDVDLYVDSHMDLARIPMFAVEIVVSNARQVIETVRHFIAYIGAAC